MSDKHAGARLTRRGALLQGAKTLAGLTAGVCLPACSEAETSAQNCPGSDAGSSNCSAASDGGKVDPNFVLPPPVAGIEFPDTRLARAAAELAFGASPQVLFNHCMRTYAFAALYFRGMGKTFDAELAFVGSVLHDLGLVDAFMSPAERFELDAADAAMKLMTEWATPPERADLVWDAIALHTNVAIASRKAPEIAMVSLGAVMDAAGVNLNALAADDVEAVLTAFPRLGFKQAAVETMIHLCEKKPIAQLLHPFADVGRRHLPGFSSPTIEDLMLAAPFSE
jgi:hypothetical protein